jgi:phosphate/sulfate permease
MSLASILLAVVVGPIVLAGCIAAVLLYALTHEREYWEKFVKPGIIGSLKDIMYGLIYPAVLGTGLVLFVLRVTKESASWLTNPILYLAVAATLFYILSFTALSEKSEDSDKLSYDLLPFCLDWIEVGLMFGCFKALGLLDEQSEQGPNLLLAYVCLLADVIVLQIVWRLAAGVPAWVGIKARVVAASLLVAGIATNSHPIVHPWIDMLIAVSVLFFVGYYLYRDVACQRGQKRTSGVFDTGK